MSRSSITSGQWQDASQQPVQFPAVTLVSRDRRARSHAIVECHSSRPIDLHPGRITPPPITVSPGLRTCSLVLAFFPVAFRARFLFAILYQLWTWTQGL